MQFCLSKLQTFVIFFCFLTTLSLPGSWGGGWSQLHMGEGSIYPWMSCPIAGTRVSIWGFGVLLKGTQKVL